MQNARFFKFALALTALVPLGATNARASSFACSEPGGSPAVVDGALQCSVGTTITESGNKPLPEATFGLIKEVRVASAIRLPLALDALLGFISQRAISVPPQDVHIRVLFNDGKELPLDLTLAPVVNLDGSTICNLHATGGAINLTRFESALPDWIDSTIARGINENEAIRAQLRDSASTALANMRPSFCR